jgi:hypothetical protein
MYIQPTTLLAMSDEDGAFLKATTDAALAGFIGESVVKQIICVWLSVSRSE